MREIHIGILGLGTVGTGIAKLIYDNGDLIASRLGAKLTLKKAADIDLARDRGIRFPDGVLTKDALEVVNVAEDDAEQGAAAGGAGQHDVEAVLKGAVVGQLGQAVGGGQPVDLLVGLGKVDFNGDLAGDEFQDVLAGPGEHGPFFGGHAQGAQGGRRPPPCAGGR